MNSYRWNPALRRAFLVGGLSMMIGTVFFFSTERGETRAEERQSFAHPANAVATTDASKNYRSSGLHDGGRYTVSPSFPGYHFTPTNHTFNNLTSNHSGNFEMSGICQNGKCVANGKIAFEQSGNIYTVNPDGTNWKSVAGGAAQDTGPNWSPDGLKIAFYSNRDGNDEIYQMNADGSNLTRLTNNPARDSFPCYSPDGSTIVFVSERDGNSEIYKMNADGSNQIRLTNDAESQRYPAFSPDGQKILYVSGVFNSSSNPLNLYTMNTDGSNKQPIPGPAVPSQQYIRPSYSPDGSKIIFSFTEDFVGQHPRTWTMNADGSNRVLFSTGSPTGGFLNHLGSYSPDGTKVVSTNILSQAGQRNFLLVSNSDGSSVQGFDVDIAWINGADWQPIPLTTRVAFDFDGDGRSDVSVFRPSDGVWHLLRSQTGYTSLQWGLASDVLTPADYDGDLKTDVAVWRASDSNFYILNSFNNTIRIENFGLAGDIQTGGDWDGDGKADLAVYRPGANGVFYYRGSMGNPNGNVTFIPWGVSGDKPVAGDFDGDGRMDAAVYRSGNWYILGSSSGQSSAVNFGLPDDTLVPADYDADGKTDIAVYRAGIWYLLRSTQGFTAFQFGIVNDKPAPADYDGDGRADAAVYRDGVWWILNSRAGTAQAVSFGVETDAPVASAFVR